MRRFLYAAVSLLLLSTAALAQTQGQIDADIDSLLASGKSPPISAADLRTVLHEMNAAAGIGSVTSAAAGCGGFSSGGAITSTGELDASLASIAHVTTDTIGNSECGRLGTFNSNSAVAITLPQANASGLFPPGWYEHYANYGGGLVTFTTTTSTFLNNGTSVLTMAGGQSFTLVSSTSTPGAWDVKGVGLNLLIGIGRSTGATSETLAVTDCGRRIVYTAGTAVTVTIPATLPANCEIRLAQMGAGKVSVNGVAVTPATLRQRQSFTGTAGLYAEVRIDITDNVGGSAATAVLTGDAS